MSYGIINQQLLTNIANAIRTKLGVATTYTPAEMPGAIASISGGGITPTGTKSITANGTYDVTNYASAEVAVPTGSSPDLGTKSITANGTYTASDDSLDGYSAVTVAVPASAVDSGTKSISITENGTTTEDVTGYASASITVNVSGGSSAQVLTGTFTGNGSNTSPAISCSFYPDVIIVGAVPPDDDATWVGCLYASIVRGLSAINALCNNTSANIPTYNYSQYSFSSTAMSNYNESTYTNRMSYATVDGSTVTIVNSTGGNAFGYFASGTTYNYTLIKYT